MDTRFFPFVWRYSKREQLIILGLTLAAFPLVYISLEIPKIIVNEAIDGSDFPRNILGVELGQIPYLLVLCVAFLAMVVMINALKWFMNVTIGMCGERMLRRLRFMLFEHVMRFRMRRFRTTRPGEVVQSMMGEIEPLGGFIGETIATPAFQGGLLGVYVAFIFVQDLWLGLAAVALYPVQAFLIPKLQAKVIRLNKARAKNARGLADTISESVNNIAEIHTNDTARWHLALLSGRLHTNTEIRLALFKRKFTIKFLNNFMNQLTPFFFYSAGGYLVIKGDLDFGALVAVLAAYKDLAAPWKQVLNYVQRWTDFNSRYTYVIETFIGEDVFGPERVYGARAQPLEGDLVLSGIEGGPGTGGLMLSHLSLRPGETVAILGGEGGAREALIKAMAGLVEPAAGSVTIGGEPVAEASLSEIGRTLAYIGSEPGMVSGSIRDNLLYSLFRDAPDLADRETAEAVDRLSEARATGNLTADSEGDWIDYAAAGVENSAALEARLLALIDLVDLADDLYSSALSSRLSPADAERWTGPIMRARARIEAEREELMDLLEPWRADRLNSNGTLIANLLYALPVTPVEDPAAYLDQPAVAEVLAESGAEPLLEAIGWDIAREFAELVDAVDAQSAVLDSFAAYGRGEIQNAAALMVAHHGQSIDDMEAEDRKSLRGLAVKFVETRDRLDVLSEARRAAILEIRGRARALIAGRADFVGFDEERFSPARTVAENILHARRRYDRKAGWKRLDERLEAAIMAEGLRVELIRLGLASDLAAAGLSATARRRVALVRALIKRPRFMLLDGPAGRESSEDRRLRGAIRADQPELCLVYGASAEAAAEDADRAVAIDEAGAVTVD